MTRRHTLVSATAVSDKPSLLRPLRPARNLTSEVVEQIAAEIRSGRLQPGQRLPTEQELMTALGVSRTVVREAVAALRAEGLVVTRQGAGAFVAKDSSRVPFRVDPAALSSLKDVLDVMELRRAVEIEAAALAAERATPDHVAAIEAALTAFKTAVDKGEMAANEDFALHKAIAAATGNPRFAHLLEVLGQHIIPRYSIRLSLSGPEEQRRYLRELLKEHVQIVAAIRAGSVADARKAMRAHLTRSLDRYRRLAEQLPELGSAAPAL
jgi:DNA-binding FadR family transcriptional regulator